MRLLRPSLILVPTILASVVQAALQVVSDRDQQHVFAGEARKTSVLFHNPSTETITADLRTRLFQVGSTTATRTTSRYLLMQSP
jgi:hypothetical protein